MWRCRCRCRCRSSRWLPSSSASSRLSFVWSWIQFSFERVNGSQICLFRRSSPGANQPPAWSDFYTIRALAIRSGVLGRCRCLVKRQLRFVPFLGRGLWAEGTPTASRSWPKNKSGLHRAFARLVSSRLPICKWLTSSCTKSAYHVESA
ncbi:hypothetical protein V8C35DRAFT_311498 [Trichoderma chlorosporum]